MNLRAGGIPHLHAPWRIRAGRPSKRVAMRASAHPSARDGPVKEILRRQTRPPGRRRRSRKARAPERPTSWHHLYLSKPPRFIPGEIWRIVDSYHTHIVGLAAGVLDHGGRSRVRNAVLPGGCNTPRGVPQFVAARDDPQIVEPSERGYLVSSNPGGYAGPLEENTCSNVPYAMADRGGKTPCPRKSAGRRRHTPPGGSAKRR